MKNILHVAIIPDGNRRWARSKGLKPWEGHEAGAKNLENILEFAKELGITHLTFWGSSRDNLIKRPYRERRALLQIYKDYFNKVLKSKKIYDNRIKINVLGDWEKAFPAHLKTLIRKVVAKTRKHNNFIVNFLLAYSGDYEMIEAVKSIAIDYKKEYLVKIDAKVIKNYLYTKALPEVDLLIRTGSFKDPHLSAGFMMWDTINSQIYFSKKAWPDFDKMELKKAIENFCNNERRYGA
ncbi:MAG: di-trans,poly-cis-decaprenylcistransferase [Candidatus Moranbacteria bacterium]|nr:di-trans,poly-cis-decaprenylcistransferase [Candidatus Moranbacteria bacterium]